MPFCRTPKRAWPVGGSRAEHEELADGRIGRSRGTLLNPCGATVLARGALGAAFAAWVLGTAVCQAQSGIPAALERPAATSPERREELYRRLEKETEYFRRQASVVKTVSKLVAPTVVYIEAEIPSRLRPDRPDAIPMEEAGSGVIVKFKDGFYVLTARHVVRNTPPQRIKIFLDDGRRIYPTRVWQDKDTDIAVLAISARNLAATPLGDSDRIEVGDFVLAVGSPFGLKQTVTFGIVSAKGRRDLVLGNAEVRFQDFIQTDAAINPGNSGGPLINLSGEVIGINTAIASNSGRNEGIGFAVPINMVVFVARQLIETGRVARAFLGVTLDTQFGPAMAAELGLPRPIGARVSGITANSPAEKANLQIGDVVLQFDGNPVEDDRHLINLVGLTEIGKEVELLILRNGESVLVEVAVGDRSQFEGSD